jgi:hypothetical protein
MKTLRRDWPQVRETQTAGHTYYVVDTRKAGLSLPRRTFKTQVEAFDCASAIAEKYSSNGKDGFLDQAWLPLIKKLVQNNISCQTANELIDGYIFKNRVEEKSISEYLDSWVQFKRNNNLTPLRAKSITGIVSQARLFQKFFNGTPIATFDRQYVESWLKEQPVSNSTKLHYKKYLSMFFNYLIDQNVLTVNPVAKIQMSAVAQTDPPRVEMKGE